MLKEALTINQQVESRLPKTSNVDYILLSDGKTVLGRLKDGTEFFIDADLIDKIKNIKLYRSSRYKEDRKTYISDCRGKPIHSYLVDGMKGLEVDHINQNTFDNRLCNLRLVTHQQNQCNQPLQKNNTSGVSGVSYYAPRKKYRARIKICQHEIHLGYYETFIEAVQARNVGVRCMFGEYGCYNDVPTIPEWIKNTVINKCKRFADLSICEAFVNSIDDFISDMETADG